jgi:hypothetical protein
LLHAGSPAKFGYDSSILLRSVPNDFNLQEPFRNGRILVGVPFRETRRFGIQQEVRSLLSAKIRKQHGRGYIQIIAPNAPDVAAFGFTEQHLYAFTF